MGAFIMNNNAINNEADEEECSSHVTYDQMKRYINASDDEYFHDSSFFESVGARIEYCETCNKRFRFFSLFPAWCTENDFEEDIIEEKLDETINPYEKFIEWLQRIYGATVEFTRNQLKFATWQTPDLMPARGLLTTGVAAFKVAKKSIDEITVNIGEKDDRIFEIKLEKKTRVWVIMSNTNTKLREFALYLWNANTGIACNDGIPYIMEESEGDEALTVITDELEIGLYFATVVEVRSFE